MCPWYVSKKIVVSKLACYFICQSSNFSTTIPLSSMVHPFPMIIVKLSTVYSEDISDYSKCIRSFYRYMCTQYKGLSRVEVMMIQRNIICSDVTTAFLWTVEVLLNGERGLEERFLCRHICFLRIDTILIRLSYFQKYIEYLIFFITFSNNFVLPQKKIQNYRKQPLSLSLKEYVQYRFCVSNL